MKTILKILSAAGLALTLLPSILYFNEVVSFEAYKTLILLGSCLWFVTAPFWIGKNKSVQ